MLIWPARSVGLLASNLAFTCCQVERGLGNNGPATEGQHERAHSNLARPIDVRIYLQLLMYRLNGSLATYLSDGVNLSFGHRAWAQFSLPLQFNRGTAGMSFRPFRPGTRV